MSQPQMQPSAPPSARILEMAFGFVFSRAVGAAAKLGIADLLKDGPRSTADLATATATNADALYRTLRALAGIGVFTEVSPGDFANNEASDALLADAPNSVRAMVLFICDDMHWAVYGDFMHSLRTGQPSFDHVYGKKPFEYLSENPEASDAFDNAMSSHSMLDAEAVANAYDFGQASSVMDVAGGSGLLLRTILQHHSALRGILFDRPHVIHHARATALVPLDRCELMEGDFFEAVPSGADYYLLKHIIHDWEDASALRILGSVRRAISPHGKVLLIEMPLPPANEPG